jgi:hypothetical protein
MFRNMSLAPGGMQTARIGSVLGLNHKNDQSPFDSTSGGTALLCKSDEEAKPIVPVRNLWATNSSPLTASRFGIDIRNSHTYCFR